MFLFKKINKYLSAEHAGVCVMNTINRSVKNLPELYTAYSSC